MEKPKISIIMAVYNGAQYLKESIDSVLSQTFKDFEFIIIDDCSSDETMSIIKSYRDPRINYYLNKRNLGQTPSLNIGLLKAKAEYIARIDADDAFLPKKLEIQYNFMKSNPEVDVCGTASIRTDENGKEIALVKMPIAEKDILFKTFYETPLIHVSVLIKHSIIMKYGGYNENYPICADYELWSKIVFDKCVVKNIPITLTKYRMYMSSTGVKNKLGSGADETAQVVYMNIKKNTNLNITKKECRDIILLFCPEAGLSFENISKSYINLIKLSKMVYGRFRPVKQVVKIWMIYFWSLLRKFCYKRKLKDLISILYLSLVKFYKIPSIFILANVSFFISILGINKIMKLRKLKIFYWPWFKT